MAPTMFEDVKEYLNWYDTRKDIKFKKDAPVIGVVLQRSHLVTGDAGPRRYGHGLGGEKFSEGCRSLLVAILRPGRSFLFRSLSLKAHWSTPCCL